jgi:hypothetical protein
VTEGFINYLKNEYLIFRVYGFADIRKTGAASKSLSSKSGVNISNNSGGMEQSTIDISSEMSK